ncbi:rRNA methyltransferase 3, mitochondrial [Agrilus planipennis]|uniref:rRNA methyltransferase 3, mitochondrial n=1 Tax=Agrilus planipennis TaxID=224129 RepID=A0A1W4WHU2_AGRPL|nr:rRNA methyltransferase 3, mitochondrial [Agrilus planipennis]XP_018319673.1 rRNA methyltransferase 3, mitochondrial [Agrilus planipennis]XP_018319674.1 rRNA methyltransferase 3, mitochondrial [Agrilus planipennis]
MDLVYRKVFTKLTTDVFKRGFQIRFYPRWQHRTPRRVYSADEYAEIELQEVIKSKQIEIEKPTKFSFSNREDSKKDHSEDTLNLNSQNKQKKKINRPKQVIKETTTTDMLSTSIDAEGNFIYSKAKNNDPQVSSILTTVKSHKHKKKEGLSLLEGKRMIVEALKANCSLKYLLFSRTKDVECIKKYLPKFGVKILKVPYREMQMWSDLVTTPGIMGIIKLPKVDEYNSPSNSLPLTIICDNIREPGNLGATLRIAAGVGAEKVILTKGCVDLWETKVLRSSMGAHFKLQIHSKMDWPSITKILDSSSHLLIADNHIVTEAEHFGKVNKADELKEIIQSIPLLPYYNLDFSKMNPLVLVIGGETEGISEESFKAAVKYKGVRLNIPLKNDVESLNTGSALSVIAFEILKQFECKTDDFSKLEKLVV